MSSIIKSRLCKKCILVSIVALIISTIIFVFLSEALAMGFANPGSYGRWEDANSSSIAELQGYIDENNLTVAHISDNNESINEELGLNLMFSMNSSASFLGNKDAWTVKGIPIRCSDGIIYAYAGHSKSAAHIAAFPVAAGSFMLITLPYTYKTVQRIMVLSRKVECMNEGELIMPVETFGTDELSALESGIENLRLSVMSQLDKKSNELDLNGRMIASLAHDIRTPLTRLTGYLDILRYKKFDDTEEFDKYLNNAARNASELNFLTEELFTTACTGGSVTSERVNELLDDLCCQLDESGFSVTKNIADIYQDVGMNELQMRRVLNNLSSNIEKYADINIPVTISSKSNEDMIDIIISNGITAGVTDSGSGIGLPTVKMLVSNCGGDFSKNESDEMFEVYLKIPAVKS